MPSKEEVAAAPTVEAYYYLQEPRDEVLSLDSMIYFEYSLTPAIAFLDEKFPSIHAIFRSNLEEIRDRYFVTKDRDAIDNMIIQEQAVYHIIEHAIEKMFTGMHRVECRLAERSKISRQL